MLSALAEPRESAFTLLELLIGMVLLLVVGGIATRAMLDGMGQEQHSNATQSAITDVVALNQQLGNDLRAMSLRETSPVLRDYDLPQLRTLVLSGAGLNDLRIAQPEHIQFIADVITPETFGSTSAAGGRGSGPECVDYAAAANGAMTRVVTPFDGVSCQTSAVLSTTPVLPAPPRRVAGTPAPPPTFTYRSRMNPQFAKDPVDPADCTSPAPAATVAGQRQRGWVVAVDLDLRAYGPQGAAPGSNELQSTVAFRTRLSHDYQYALGCSY